MTGEDSTNVGEVLGHGLSSPFLQAGFCPQSPQRVTNTALSAGLPSPPRALHSWLCRSLPEHLCSLRSGPPCFCLRTTHSLSVFFGFSFSFFSKSGVSLSPKPVLFSSSPSLLQGVPLPIPRPNNHPLVSEPVTSCLSCLNSELYPHVSTASARLHAGGPLAFQPSPPLSSSVLRS